jgi:hypothetical protein
LGAINRLRAAVERATIKFSVRGKVVEIGARTGRSAQSHSD